MDIPRDRGREGDRRTRSRPPRKVLIQRALRNLEVSELGDDDPDREPRRLAELDASGEEVWRALVRRPNSLLDLSWNGEWGEGEMRRRENWWRKGQIVLE